jgi:hypothetical protein
MEVASTGSIAKLALESRLLIREILDNPETLKNIGIWLGEQSTKVVSFFFWNSSTALQRS